MGRLFDEGRLLKIRQDFGAIIRRSRLIECGDFSMNYGTCFFCNYQRIYILSAIISMQTDDNEGRVKVVGAHTHIEIIVNFTALSVGVCCVTGEIWWWSRRLYEVKSWNQTQVVFTFLCGPDVATCLVQINAWEIQILKLIIIEECNSVMTAAYPSLTQSTTASTRGSHGHRPKSQLPKWGKVTLV